MEKKKDINVAKVIIEYIEVLIGTAGVAASAYFFMFPCNLAIGSVSGVSMLLNRIIGVRISLISLVINVALMIIGMIFIGRDFGFKTVFSTIMFSGCLAFYENVFPLDASLTGDGFTDMVCYCIVVAISQAILFRINASSGGLDILAKLLNVFMGLDLGTGMIVAGMAAALPCFFMYDMRTGIISVLGTYASGLVLDYYLSGFTTKKRVCILSQKKEDVSTFIKTELSRGITLYEAKGGYSGQVITEIVTILNRDEYVKLMTYLKKNDPAAFVTVSSVSEVVGEWSVNRGLFKSKRK